MFPSAEKTWVLMCDNLEQHFIRVIIMLSQTWKINFEKVNRVQKFHYSKRTPASASKDVELTMWASYCINKLWKICRLQKAFF